MASTQTPIIKGVLASNTYNEEYSVPAGKRARITAFQATNVNAPGGAAATISVQLRANGGADENAKLVANEVSIDAGETRPIIGAISQSLEAQDEIHVKSDTASTIAVYASGIEFTTN